MTGSQVRAYYHDDQQHLQDQQSLMSRYRPASALLAPAQARISPGQFVNSPQPPRSLQLMPVYSQQYYQPQLNYLKSPPSYAPYSPQVAPVVPYGQADYDIQDSPPRSTHHPVEPSQYADGYQQPRLSRNFELDPNLSMFDQDAANPMNAEPDNDFASANIPSRVLADQQSLRSRPFSPPTVSQDFPEGLEENPMMDSYENSRSFTPKSTAVNAALFNLPPMANPKAQKQQTASMMQLPKGNIQSADGRVKRFQEPSGKSSKQSRSKRNPTSKFNNNNSDVKRLTESLNQIGMDESDELDSKKSKNSQYWKQFEDQFDILT